MRRARLTFVFSVLALLSSTALLAQPVLILPPGSLAGTSSPGVQVTVTDTVATVQFYAQFTGLPTGYAIANTTYLGWCPDYFGDFSNNTASTPYTLYSSYAPALPVNAQSANWDKVNWLLNHKPTGSQSTWIVQQVMWRLMAGQYGPASQGFPLPQPDTDNLYNQALAQGAGFMPTAGQVVGVLMYIDGIYDYPDGVNGLPGNGQPNVFQEVLIEVPVTSWIGDFVWSDLNNNGIQDAGEPGINGVTVQLLQGSTLIATTVTGPAPAGYPFSPPGGGNGFYQFSELNPGTYTVYIDNTQPALGGYLPAKTGQGTPATDSNANPYTVTLAPGTFDATIDFGYWAPAAVILQCPANTTGVVGVPYSSALVATGGTGVYTFSITTGSLPPLLSLNTSTGAITGTPTTAGPYPFTAKVVDNSGLPAGTATASCGITVAPLPTATCVVINAIQGVAITPVTMTGSGGAGGPYTFSATSLPPGLSISAGGTISGTPTASGTYNYTVTVTDKSGNTGTVNCSVTVAPPVSATCVVINAVQGEAITPVTLTGSGGAGGPYTFSATGLPPGLTMSSGGTISGTPTATGTYNYTVTVTDKYGNTGTVNCSVTVYTAPMATCIVINAIQNVAITPVTMVGSGGAGGPYTFTATGLPPGLNISMGGIISGTPSASGTYSYTVTVTDKSGNTGTVNCSVTVAPPVSATCVVITAVQGVAITPVTLVGSGRPVAVKV